MRTYLANELGWRGQPDEKTEYFAIIRHPVERWISGIAQCFAHMEGPQGGPHPFQKPWQDHIRRDLGAFVDVAWWDMHTAPQACHLAGYPHVKLFKIDNLAPMWDWLGADQPEEIRNHHAERKWREDLYRFIQVELEVNPQMVRRLEKRYSADLDIYNLAE